MIFSALALLVVIFRGSMVNPYGIWCEFVWVFCIVVPLVITVMEALALNVLLAAFLPNWADLTCGLTMLCALTITSATVSFTVVFACFSCIDNIFCVVFSLVATAAFLVDAVMQKMKCPGGYLSNLRGILRFTEAFLGCVLLAAASSYFLGVEWRSRPAGMVWSMAVFAVCLLLTVVIIGLHLLQLLQCLLSFGLNKMEMVFNIVAVVLYVSAVVLWSLYGYRHNYSDDPPDANIFPRRDMNTVVVGSGVNLILYVVDLVLSIMAR